METSKTFDFASFKEEAMKDLVSGKPMMGEGGIFTPLLKHFLEATLQGELYKHLGAEKATVKGNSAQRTVEERSSEQYGEIRVGNTSRDRHTIILLNLIIEIFENCPNLKGLSLLTMRCSKSLF